MVRTADCNSPPPSTATYSGILNNGNNLSINTTNNNNNNKPPRREQDHRQLRSQPQSFSCKDTTTNDGAKARGMLAYGQISFDCGLFALGNISRLLCKHRMKPSSAACVAHVWGNRCWCSSWVRLEERGQHRCRGTSSLAWQRQLLW